MDEPLMDREGTWEEIVAELPDLAHKTLHVTIRVVPKLNLAKKTDFRPIAEILAELAARTDLNEAAKLPADFSSQIDHYLYGAPKR